MADNQVVDSLRLRVAGAGNNTWPQFSVSPSNSLWLTDSADPLNTSPNAALQISITPSSAFIEALGTDGVSSKQLQLGNAGGVALVPNGGNVGIGTTTPSQALEVAGAVKATSFLLGNTPLVSSQWTSGAGGISFAGGKVGVGTATPSEMLEVNGAVKATSFVLNNAPIVSSQWTSGAGGISFAGGKVGVGTATPSEMLEVAGTVKATSFLLGNAPIVSSQWTSGAGGLSFAGGNVGIGTATPSETLEVNGTVKATSFVLGNAPIVSSQWTSGAGGLSFAGGNVGVGTATPSETLEVAGSVKATSFLLGNAPIVSSQWTSGAGGISFAGGAVGIGTATPSQALEVAGTVKASAFLLGNAPLVNSQWTNVAGGINFAGGKVGIGTATPSQALEVAGTVKASAFLLGNAPLVNSQWTNVAGGINFAGGKVGIGTTTPNGLLDVGNIVRIGLDEGGSGAKVITFARDAADEGNSGKIAYKPSWDGGVLGIVGVGAPNHPRRVKVWDQVETSGSLLVGGAVGIGVPSPGFSLDVGARMRARQGSDASAGIWFYQTGPANDRAFVGMANDNQVGFWGNTGAAWGLVMDTSSGAVGIGTTNPTNKLTVDIGPNGPVDTGITIQGSTSAAGDLGVRINNTGAGGIEWYIDSTNNKSGYGGGKLAFVPVVGSLPTVTMLQSGDMTVRGHLWVNGTDIHLTGRGGGNGNNNAWGRALVDLGQGGGLVVNYDNDFGQVRIDGPVFARVVGAPSDARLKTNITPLTGVLDKLEQIRGVGFEWTGAEAALTGPAGAPAIGLIAQEVEAVFPELVLRWGENDYRAIDYSRLTSVLVEAVKELRREVAALKTAPGAAAG